jgi:PEP-CTERM putative exosortase interaction domain
MTSAGHSWTVSTGITFDLPTLCGYDGIFLAGDAADNTVLINYVNAGGNVYLAGGTGWGGAEAEAARWNTFLNEFGLEFADFYNYGLGYGNVPITSDHPIFDQVDHLYQLDGNDTLDINVIDPRSEVLVSINDHGLYAVYDSGAPVPEPATMLLLGSGLIFLAAFRRRFRRR